MNRENRPPTSPRSSQPNVSDWDLTGDLSKMPIISALQFLELSRQTGVLVIAGDDGSTHQAWLLEGTVADAMSRHLRGAEAAMSILALRAGRFSFGAREVAAGDGQRMSVSPLIMEAVRLEDELERLSAFLPDANAPLVLRNPNEVPVDPLDCGADMITATIAARPRVTIAELEQSAPLASVKVRLSVAFLASSGRLRSRQSVSMVIAPFSKHWYSQIQVYYPGGLRVLVGAHPERGAQELIPAITALARELDSGPAWMSLALDGAAIARVRPRAGGLLSLACLPMISTHEASFRSFASTAGLVLVCSAVTGELREHWSGLVPPAVPSLPLAMGGASTLVDAMRSFAERCTKTGPSAPREPAG
jgi:hypothetical protein